MPLESRKSPQDYKSSIESQKQRIGSLQESTEKQLTVIHSKIDNIVKIIDQSQINEQRKNEILKSLYERLKKVISPRQLTNLTVDLAGKLAELRLLIAGRKIEAVKKSAEIPVKTIVITAAKLIDNYNDKIDAVGMQAVIEHIESVFKRAAPDYIRRYRLAKSKGKTMKPAIKMTAADKRAVNIFRLRLLRSKLEKEGMIKMKKGQYIRDSKMGWYVARIISVKNGHAELSWLIPPKKIKHKKGAGGKKYLIFKESSAFRRLPSGLYREIDYSAYYKKKYGELAGKNVVRASDLLDGKEKGLGVVDVEHDMGKVKKITKANETNAYKEYKKRFKELQKMALQDALRNNHFEVKHQLKNYLVMLKQQLAVTQESFRRWRGNKDDKSIYGFTEIGAAIGMGSLETKDVFSEKMAEWRGKIREIGKKIKIVKKIITEAAKGEKLSDDAIKLLAANENDDLVIKHIYLKYLLGKNPNKRNLMSMRKKLMVAHIEQKDYLGALTHFNKAASKYLTRKVNIDGRLQSFYSNKNKASVTLRIVNLLKGNKALSRVSVTCSDDLKKLIPAIDQARAKAKKEGRISMFPSKKQILDEIVRLKKIESEMSKSIDPKLKDIHDFMRSMRKMRAKIIEKLKSKKIWDSLTKFGKGFLDILNDPTTALQIFLGALSAGAGNVALSALLKFKKIGKISQVAFETMVAGLTSHVLNNASLYLLTAGKRGGKEFWSYNQLAKNIIMGMGYGVSGGAIAKFDKFLLKNPALGKVIKATAQNTTSVGLAFTADMASIYDSNGKLTWKDAGEAFLRALQTDLISKMRVGQKYALIHYRMKVLHSKIKRLTKKVRANPDNPRLKARLDKAIQKVAAEYNTMMAKQHDAEQKEIRRKEKMKETKKRVSEGARKTASKVREGGRKAIDSTKSGAKKMLERGKEMGQRIGERSRDLAGKTSERSAELAKRAGEASKKVVEGVKKGGKRIGEGTSSVVKRIGQRASDTANRTRERAKKISETFKRKQQPQGTQREKPALVEYKQKPQVKIKDELFKMMTHHAKKQRVKIPDLMEKMQIVTPSGKPTDLKFRIDPIKGEVYVRNKYRSPGQGETKYSMAEFYKKYRFTSDHKPLEKDLRKLNMRYEKSRKP